MLFYPVLFFNKNLCRPKAFSEISNNLPNQKLNVIKLNNLKELKNLTENYFYM